MAPQDRAVVDMIGGLLTIQVFILRKLIAAGTIDREQAVAELREFIDDLKRLDTPRRTTETVLFERLIDALSDPSDPGRRPAWTPVVIEGGVGEER